MRISQKRSNDESDKGYFLEVNVRYIEQLHELLNDLPFLPERKKIEKYPEQLIADQNDEIEYVIHIRNSKQALNHGLVLKSVHRVIKFNQSASEKPVVDMNIDLRKKSRKDFEKDFF